MTKRKSKSNHARHPHKRGSANSTLSPTSSSTASLAELQTDVKIDGSKGEGGGQIVRTSIALASVLDVSLKIIKIRYNRSKPGLQAQHLEGVNLVSKVANSELKGACFGSQTFVLEKSERQEDEDLSLPIESKISTAGAVSLVLQAALPVIVRFLKPSEEDTVPTTVLQLHGGTCVPFAPTSYYVMHVLVPNLKHFGLDITYEVIKHGYYPRGGGLAYVTCSKQNCIESSAAKESDTADNKKSLRPWTVTQRGDLVAVKGIIAISGNSEEREEIAQVARLEMIRGYRRGLNEFCESCPFTEADVSIEYDKPDGNLEKHRKNDMNLCITVYAETSNQVRLGSSTVWSRKDLRNLVDGNSDRSKQRRMDLSASCLEAVAQATVTLMEEFCTNIRSGAVVDEHMADQLFIWMAMANGRSIVTIPKPTMHVKSVIDVLREFGVEVSLQEETDDRYRVECVGKSLCLY